MRFAAPISVLALIATAEAQTRPHPYDLRHVRWEVTLNPENSSIDGTVTNEIVAKKGTREVAFDAIGLRVRSVSVNGKPTTYSSKNGKLSVRLPAPADGRRLTRIVVRYGATPQSGLYFIPASRAFPAKTPSVYSQGEMEDNRNWIPTYDYPDDKATTEGIIHVPKGWRALSNGRLLAHKKSARRDTWHWKIDKPHSTYLISVVAGPYSEVIERTGKVPVSFWVPVGLESMGRASFGRTAPIVDFFSKLTRYPYPYSKYAQSAVPDFMFGGMENITATTQTIGALHPAETVPIEDATGLVAHELAHQWFGDTVTTTGWSDIWINEGWATFLPNFYVRERDGQEAYELARYETIASAFGANASDRPMVYKGYKDPIDMFDGMAYAGGAARMFMLMEELGEEKFWDTCGKYLRAKQFTAFDTREFFRVWSKFSGRDLTPFMRQWFYTSSVPRLEVKREGTKLSISEATGKFDLQVPVRVWTGDRWMESRVRVAKGAGEFELPSAEAPYLVDPRQTLLDVVDYREPFSFSRRRLLFEKAQSLTERLHVMDRLFGGLEGPESVEVLGMPELAGNDALLARWIPQVRDDAQEARILDLAKSRGGHVAMSAIRWLADRAKDPGTADELLRWGASQANPLIEQECNRAALRLKGDDSLAETLWNRDSYNDGYRRIALDYWRGDDPDLARARALSAIRDRLPEPTRVHAIRMLGSLKDVEDSREVFDALVRIAEEPSFGARSAAVDALAEYGDREALEVLRPLLRHPLVFLRNNARGAVAALEAQPKE
jgi:aminopeptidase N